MGGLAGLVGIGVLLAAGCGSDPADPAPREADVRILFIGNSLTAWNDLPFMVEAMADSAGVEPMVAARVLISNASLEDHWLAGQAPAAIRAGGWDVIVVQQGPSSQNQEHLVEWASVFGALADSIGARLALYMVWPERSRLEAFDGVSQSYRVAAEVAMAALYPAGEAWRAAWELDPDMALYGPDGFHPSTAGSYLAALTIFQGIYGVAPDAVPARLRLRSGAVVDIGPSRAATLRAASATATAEFGVR